MSKKIPGTIYQNSNERGNVFFALFGAVAVVGVIGAASMSIMRGPLTTMVEVNKRTQAESQMQLAGRMAIVQSAEQTASGDCDSDGFIEPLLPASFGTTPSGALINGGALPNTIGATKTDPWGTEYGYCIWNAGAVNNGGGCSTTTPGLIDGSGDGSENYAIISIVSAGPDRTFTTNCRNYASAGAGNRLAVKTAGTDDIIMDFTYGEAQAFAGGLWKIQSGNPNIAEISKDLEVAGGAKFTGATSDSIFDLQNLAGSLRLPDQSITDGAASCNSANEGILRRNTVSNPPTVEICYNNGGVWEWASVAAGSSDITRIADDDTIVEVDDAAGTVTFDIGGSNVATINSTALNAGGLNIATTGTLGAGDTLINGTLGVNGNVTLGDNAADTVSITGLLTANEDVDFDKGLNVQGDVVLGDDALNDVVTITASLDAQGNANVAGTLDVDGNVTLGDASADTITINGALNAVEDVDFDKNLNVDGYVVINNSGANDPALNVTGNILLSGNLDGDNATFTTVTIDGAGTSLDVSGDAEINGMVLSSDYKIISGGSTYDFVPASCAAGSFNRWDGDSWECEADTAGGGSGDPNDELQNIEEVLSRGSDANGEGLENLGTTVIGYATATGSLLLDVEGKVGATEFCLNDDSDCFTPTDAAAAIARDTFVELTDTPASYTGFGTYIVRVNAGGTGLEFVDATSITGGGAINIDDLGDAFHDTTTDFDGDTLDNDDNLFIGHEPANLTSGARNTVIGAQTGESISTGRNNIMIGLNAGNDVSTANDVIAIGKSAGEESNANSNIILGTNAGFTAGIENTVIGAEAFYSAQSVAQGNVVIGHNAAHGPGYNTGDPDNNVIIGREAALNLNNSDQNVVIGRNAAHDINDGDDNTMIGYGAGYTTTDGNNNIIIGHSTNASSPTASNELNIGSAIYGNLSTDQIGIGVASAAAINTSSLFELSSTIRGFLMPRMTEAERDAIATPATGLQVYNTDENTVDYYNGSVWVSFAATSGGAHTLVDADNDTTIEVDTAGDGSANTTVFTNNGAETMRILDTGKIGIGTSTPQEILDIVASSTSDNGSIAVSHTDTTKGTSLDLFTVRPSLTDKIGISGNKGWAISTLPNSYTSGYDNDLVVAAYDGTGSTGVKYPLYIDKDGAIAIADQLDGTLVRQPQASALLDLYTTTKGFLPPRIADPAGDIASPAAGLIAYDSTDNELQVYDGTSWVSFSGAGSGATDDSLDWDKFVDAMTLDATTSIDMDTNTANLNFDSDTFVIDSVNNRIGVGTNAPAYGIHVANTNLGVINNGVSSYINIGMDENNNETGTVGAGIRFRNDGAVVGHLNFVENPSPLIYLNNSTSHNTPHLTIASDGRIGMGVAGANSSAKLELNSSSQGFLPPRMSEAQRDAITTPATGLQVYNTDTNTLDYFDGSSWLSFASSSGSSAQLIDADNDTSIEVDTAGDGSANTTVFTNGGSETMRITEDGFIGVGTNNPINNFELVSSAGTYPGYGYFTISGTSTASNYSGMEFGTSRPNPASQFGIAGNKAWEFGAFGVNHPTVATREHLKLFYADTTSRYAMSIDTLGRVMFGGGAITDVPQTSAQLEIRSTTQGFLPPRMSEVQRDAIATPATGLQVYNTDTNTLDYFDGSSWLSFASSSGSSAQLIDADNDTSIEVDTAGDGSANTTIFTNNAAETMRIQAGGNVGVGTNSPANKLHVAGNIRTNNGIILGLTAGDPPTYVSPPTSIAPNSLDWDDFTNSMTLDASTIIDMNTNTASLTFDGTDNLLFIDGNANNIGIGTATVDTSSLLELSSTTRGFLPPRMTTAERDAINSGTFATGLTVYNTTTNTLQYYDGTTWQNASAAGGLAINDLSDATTDYTTDFNMFMGDGAGANITTGGQYNLAIGINAGTALTTGDDNIVLGYGALATSENSQGNIAIGRNAITNYNQTGRVMAIGRYAGESYQGDNWHSFLAIGDEAARNVPTGSSITAIGQEALRNRTGSGNTGIGNLAFFLGSGNDSIAVGVFAGGYASGSRSVIIGNEAFMGGFNGDFDHSGNDSVYIGYRSARSATGNNNDQNVFVGSNSGSSLRDGTNNILIGYNVDVSSGTSTNELNIGNAIYGNISTDQIGIGVADAASINSSSLFELSSTTRGFLPPRMTTAERDAINSGTFATGLTVYNTTTNTLQYYDGTTWQNASAAGGLAINDLSDASTTSSSMYMGLGAGPSAVGVQNTVLGIDAFVNATTGINNTFVGWQAGGNPAMADGNMDDNTVIGTRAGYNLSSGATGNILLGYRAGMVATTGDNNIVIGNTISLSGFNAQSELNIGNTIYGNLATDQIGIGAIPVASAQFDINSTTRGFLPPRMTTTERDAINSGTFATGLTVYNTTTNTLQYYDGTTWQNASAAGGLAINDLSDATTDYTTDFNMFMGDGAGANITTGAQGNLAIGQNALNSATLSNDNMAIGYNALALYNPSAPDNNEGMLAIGRNALGSATEGRRSIAIGNGALSAYTPAGNESSVAIGINAMWNVTGADANTVLGAGAGGGLTQAYENVIIGHNAGSNSFGQNNIQNNTIIGTQAGLISTNAVRNTIIGSYAGNAAFGVGSGTDNILIGHNVTVSANNASNQLNIGNAIYGNVSTDQIGIGVADAASINSSSLFELSSTTRGFLPPRMTTTERNAINSGTFATGLTIYNTTTNTLQYYDGTTWQNASAAGGLSINDLSDAFFNTTSDNLIIGHEATSLTSGTKNTIIGSDAANNITSGGYNVIIGEEAQIADPTSGAGVAIGVGAKAGGLSVSIGKSASESNGGYGSVTIGYYAGQAAGGFNTLVGHQAMYGGSNTGEGNVAIGDNAGQGSGGWNSITGDNNVFVGRQAGRNIVGGGTNVMIGYQAGDSVTSGNSNIVIGNNVDLPTATTSNHLNIGSTIYGDLSTDRVGIGKVPAAGIELDVLGDVNYSGTLTNVSDRRKKQDIHKLDTQEIIQKLTKVDTYTYRKIDDPDQKVEYGVMAQELENLFPELVRTAPDEMGTKTVNYIGLIAPIIEATKALKVENDQLKAELAEMQMQQKQVLSALETIKTDVKGLKAYTGFGVEQANSIALLFITVLMGGVSALLIIRRRQNTNKSRLE